MKKIKYKNINEEVKRMKSLFTKERLYGNLVSEQVTNPDTNGDNIIDTQEFQNSGNEISKEEGLKFVADKISSQCQTNPIIQEATALLTANNFDPNKYKYGKLGKDCYVTIASVKKEGSFFKNNLTLFDDNSFVLSILMNNLNSDKRIAWTGDWNTAGDLFNVKYKGEVSRGSGAIVSKPAIDIIANDGNPLLTTAAMISDYNVSSADGDPIKSDDIIYLQLKFKKNDKASVNQWVTKMK